jgi:hypothetical protein
MLADANRIGETPQQMRGRMPIELEGLGGVNPSPAPHGVRDRVNRHVLEEGQRPPARGERQIGSVVQKELQPRDLLRAQAVTNIIP